MLRKIFISGVHSSGKTTLFGRLKEQLCIENGKVIFCPELAREIMANKGYSVVSTSQSRAYFGTVTLKISLRLGGPSFTIFRKLILLTYAP